MTSMLNNLINQGHYQSILCLNGDLPEPAFFTRNLPIIAADGAANLLQDAGITPDLILGDLDSLRKPWRHPDRIMASPDQNRSDFEKCLLYLETNQLLPTLIVGLSGGYLDHVLNNVNIFLQTGSLFYAPPIAGFTLPPGTKSLSLPFDTKISLMGFPAAAVKTTGLKWELTDDTPLSFPGKNSCFNRTEAPTVQINVSKGRLLVLVYLEKIFDAGCNVRSLNTG